MGTIKKKKSQQEIHNSYKGNNKEHWKSSRESREILNMEQRLRAPQWVYTTAAVLVSVISSHSVLSFLGNTLVILDSCRFGVKGATGQNFWPINTLWESVEGKFVTGTLLLTTEMKILMLSGHKQFPIKFSIEKAKKDLTLHILTHQRWLSTESLETIIFGCWIWFPEAETTPLIIHVFKRVNHH